jgi:hypothetical protein
VLAVFEITNPRLQGRGVVLPDDGAVRLDGRVSADRGPFACGSDEGDIDGWVCGEVVGFAGFGVCVEEQV